ncbi:MgtC/SapB family protein [Edaphobacter albus]|uniref:MgtC/SapB family protein n=1 Tax=Edaphobacter sp. 4G125 TaxID=2763071 RepID=UPI0016443A80|nr:MgtC/SapB family protein [Edaphobacter sp. 4G125]QNI37599.1 MgtC/SapB family protein [Edaphobacter sp. 4G125]
MLVPQFHFSQIDQELLSTGTVARLLTACFLGGAIGLEREWRHKAAGLRTNLLICLGSAFFTLLSAVLAGEGNPDKGRVAANVVQGIGFLGAGIILHNRDRVVGLTSAATVFAVASIGMASGAGLYLEAVLAAIITLFALSAVGYVESRAGWKHISMLYEVRGTNQRALYITVLSVLDRMGIRLNVVERESIDGFERMVFSVPASRRRHQDLIQELRQSASTDQVVVFRDSEEE